MNFGIAPFRGIFKFFDSSKPCKHYLCQRFRCGIHKKIPKLLKMWLHWDLLLHRSMLHIATMPCILESKAPFLWLNVMRSKFRMFLLIPYLNLVGYWSSRIFFFYPKKNFRNLWRPSTLSFTTSRSCTCFFKAEVRFCYFSLLIIYFNKYSELWRKEFAMK